MECVGFLARHQVSAGWPCEPVGPASPQLNPGVGRRGKNLKIDSQGLSVSYSRRESLVCAWIEFARDAAGGATEAVRPRERCPDAAGGGTGGAASDLPERPREAPPADKQCDPESAAGPRLAAPRGRVGVVRLPASRSGRTLYFVQAPRRRGPSPPTRGCSRRRRAALWNRRLIASIR